MAKDSAATFWKFAEALSAGAWKRKNVDQQDYESTLAFAAAHLSPNDGAALRFALSMRYYSVRVEKSRQQWKAEVPSTAFCNTVLQHDAAEHLATHCDTFSRSTTLPGLAQLGCSVVLPHKWLLLSVHSCVRLQAAAWNVDAASHALLAVAGEDSAGYEKVRHPYPHLRRD
jgi:hypothetical protein